jgi:arsenate reductase
MNEYIIYHNPRCTKSRESLLLLQQEGLDPEVCLYLENPPSRAELVHICELLGVGPLGITREKDDIPMDLDAASDDEIFDMLAKYPRLIERPIIVKDGKEAVIGRPPENIEVLFN